LDPEEPLVLNVLGQAKVVLHATTLSVTTLFLNLLSAKHEMPFMLLYLLTASNIAAPSSTEEFLGTMAFYRDAKYGHHLGTLKVDVANRCYNLDCSHLNNNVASVTWTGLPLDATYDDETSAQVCLLRGQGLHRLESAFPDAVGWGLFALPYWSQRCRLVLHDTSVLDRDRKWHP